MVRDNKVTVSFDDIEYDEIVKRAKEAHLSVATYCRHFLFEVSSQVVLHRPQQEAIERIKKPPPPPDPFIKEKQKAHATFLTKVKVDLVEALANENHLKAVPESVKEEIKEYKQSRLVIINKESKGIEAKNLKAGF